MKLDAPSGTAITLAEDLVREMPEKRGWCAGPSGNPSEIGVVSERRGEVPGIHSITWESEDDVIEITHSAKNRRGFALGAVLAAEFCLTRKGIFNMNDLLNL
jgi:4-hydroxy-tetrahydrodipicolinate reductase